MPTCSAIYDTGKLDTYPDAVGLYVSLAQRPNGELAIGYYDRVHGNLMIRDTPIEVVLDCELEGRGLDPWGKTRVGISFRTEIDRREWGLKWNQAIETGGVLVANKVRIEGQVQFVRDEA